MADYNDKAIRSKPSVLVGLDFGTTHSGFAFAHISDPERMFTFYDYPKTGAEKPYCKTLTASYYKSLTPASEEEPGRWKLQSWGFLARADYERDNQALQKFHKPQNDPSKTPSTHPKGVGKIFSRLRISSSQSATSNAPSTQDEEQQLHQFPLKDLHESSVRSSPSVGILVSRFKLHVASEQNQASSASPLPPGLTVERVITDYLRELGGLVIKHLKDKYGAHFKSEFIQWCITVPSIWDNSAKATMKACMKAAGLVSPYSVVVVLEPEAASFHCHKVMGAKLTLQVCNKVLVADMGGGTSDVVVQEVVSTVGKAGYRVKEVTTSSGGLCGGTYVDARFMEFLEGRIGPCLQECILKHPNVYEQLMKQWEFTKSSFGCDHNVTTIDLPTKLAMEWRNADWMKQVGNPGGEHQTEWEGCDMDLDPDTKVYDELEMSHEERQSIFDPVVQENLDLIEQQLDEAGGTVEVLFLVGGFTESPYLLHRLKQSFESRVGSIICPQNPGSAICQGAVALAFHPKTIRSRIYKRTYGFAFSMPFEREVDPIESFEIVDGIEYCKDIVVKRSDCDWVSLSERFAGHVGRNKRRWPLSLSAVRIKFHIDTQRTRGW